MFLVLVCANMDINNIRMFMHTTGVSFYAGTMIRTIRIGMQDLTFAYRNSSPALYVLIRG